MNKIVSQEIKELIETVHYRPAVSVIIPFEPKMVPKDEINLSLKRVKNSVERELANNYPEDLVQLVTGKLKNCLANLNYNGHQKSIAIYVSPVFEKVLYLDIPVEEKIIIDESFEIRDLVYCKKELHKYLVLVLSGKEFNIFIGNTETFVKVVSDAPQSVYAYINEVPEKVANFSDNSSRREVIMDKFLHHIDNTLDIILKAYKLPLFVLGTDRIAGHFKALTRHAADVIDYVHGNYEEATAAELKTLLQPYVADWKKLKQAGLLKRLEAAANDKRLSSGITDVWKQASRGKGQLLLVEKNYMCAAVHGGNDEVIYKEAQLNNFSCIKDAVDDVIERVLEGGGDVEFVDAEVLNKFNRIALIQYY